MISKEFREVEELRQQLLVVLRIDSDPFKEFLKGKKESIRGI